ncbi:MAG: porin [Helicobacteraceae bacterium]|nr:porin [Helicobacteraceae bacterium]
MKKIILSVATATLLTLPISASEVDLLKQQLSELTKRLSTLESKEKVNSETTMSLTEELSNIQNESSFTKVDSENTQIGLGEAASKVYYSKSPLSIGGYGEMYFAKRYDRDSDKTDTYRFIPYFGYKFTDNIILNTEIEFEHGGDTVAIEFMYLDFLINENFNLRVGNQLVPMGLVNERHEPTLFNTVQRPETERYVIPSTWHETGVIAYGSVSDFEYQIGSIVALDMINSGTNVDDGSWIRDARIGSKSKDVRNMAAVARVDYKAIKGLDVGISGYAGNAGADSTTVGSEGLVTIYDIHAQYQNNNFALKALYASTSLSNASSYSDKASSSSDGGYINAEYNILPMFSNSTQRLPIFAQYEQYNPRSTAVDGSSYDDIKITTIGANYFPTEQVVLKLDYQSRDNDVTNSKKSENTLSFGLGFIF